MVAQARVNVHETMGRKNNCKLNFFLMYLIWNNKEIHFKKEHWKIADTNFNKDIGDVIMNVGHVRF